MFDRNEILGLIRNITKVLSKDGNAVEKAIANKVEEKLFPKPLRTPVLVVIEEQKKVIFRNAKGREYKAVCQEGDTFDRYVGASLVLGRAKYGNSKKFAKAVNEWASTYGITFEPFEKLALTFNYFQYGGKEAFETYVDNMNVNKPTETNEETDE